LKKTQTLIGGDAVDPGIELRILPEIFNVLMDFDKDLLRNIVGIIMVNNHFTDMPINPLLVYTHQQVKAIVPRFCVP
jgi:hypothetical protein